MKFQLNGLRVPISKSETPLKALVAKETGLPLDGIKELTIIRESVDARKKFSLAFVYSLELEITASQRTIDRALKTNSGLKLLSIASQPKLTKGDIPLGHRPVVVGAGPAGYFAALTLAAHGYSPLLIERGDDVETRTKKVKEFWHKGLLDPESNVQFGEGGAGTFSDGKLTTRINDSRITYILKTMVESGAPEEILYKHKPHVGTDRLQRVVKGLREKIVAYGGEVRFCAKLTGLKLENGKLGAIEINGWEEIPAQAVVLALGHSARDTYAMLEKTGIIMEAKPFAVGLRVEHHQGLIDNVQFGENAGHPKLGAADYQLTYQDSETGRAAYAFCMCPGGKVVAATSEVGQVVTNGMSEFARDTGIANSAVVVTVGPEDFPTDNSLGGVEFQRIWEKKAYKLGGGEYKAPAQSVEDFVNDRVSSKLELDASYLPGVTLADLREALPKEVGEVLGRAIESFDRKIAGFNTRRATLTGVETRTSAPLRMLRNEKMESTGISGIYPCGEGAGYAGGITSAAVDGIRVAEAIIRQHAPAERSY